MNSKLIEENQDDQFKEYSIFEGLQDDEGEGEVAVFSAKR